MGQVCEREGEIEKAVVHYNRSAMTSGSGDGEEGEVTEVLYSTGHYS